MMNRKQFLERLEWLLSDLPAEEREEAISWYQSYFEDAGEENEAAVIERLRSPEEVAASIRENLKGSASGGFTEAGYESFTGRKVPAKREDVRREKRAEYDGPYPYRPGGEKRTRGTDMPGRDRTQGCPDGQRSRQEPPARRGRPAWVTVLLTILGVTVIVILAIILLIVGVAGAVCLFSGIALFVFGVPAGGVAVAGFGLIFLAIFFAVLAGEIIFCRQAMPVLAGRRGGSRV